MLDANNYIHVKLSDGSVGDFVQLEHVSPVASPSLPGWSCVCMWSYTEGRDGLAIFALYHVSLESQLHVYLWTSGVAVRVEEEFWQGVIQV